LLGCTVILLPLQTVSPIALVDGSRKARRPFGLTPMFILAFQTFEMKSHAACILALLSCFTVTAALGQAASCSQVRLLARMAHTNSSPALKRLGALVDGSYRSKLIFAFRLFEIGPAETGSALKVIELIPRNQDQDAVWHSLEGPLCDQESVEDIKALGRLEARLPHDLAKAVDMHPDKMHDFVSYAYQSIQDPESDYAVQMQPVCRHHHGQFLNAVNQMTEKDRNWFAKKIFDPGGCRALALPEAD
jgi:hypothetical protein